LEGTQNENLLTIQAGKQYLDMITKKGIYILITALTSIGMFAFMPIIKKTTQKRSNPTDNKKLDEHMERAWKVSFERFYHPKTKLFYDYITSYEKNKWLAHLPTREEISRQYPNEYGYGTGMEDCMISAGVMLDLIADRYAVTGDRKLKQIARDVFEGVYRTATVHGINGFLPRGLSPEDAESCYIASSRDQYTHAVHGLWVYHRSPLSEGPARKRIARVLTAIADRMKATVIAENNYNALMADGRQDPRGIQKMWEVKAHEAARLPMIYAAAWIVSGDEKYYHYYREYIADAVAQSFDIEDQTPTYSLLQMQSCFELLSSIEKDMTLKKQMDDIMGDVSRRAAQRAIRANQIAKTLDLTLLPSDWRTGEGIRTGSVAREVWYNPRESGEAAVTQLIGGCGALDKVQREMLNTAILRIDYDRVATSGIFYLQGAYWKARRYGCL
jgi:hypothetical protein